MVGQILVGMGLAAHTDLHPGEGLGTHLRDDGLDAVVSAGGAVGTDPQPSGNQGDVVEQDDDPLGRNIEISGQLQYAAAGQVHVGQGFQQKQFLSVIGGLAVDALELAFVYLAVQVFRQNIQAAETHIVTGVGVILSGVAQAHDEPAFIRLTKHMHRAPQRIPF